MSSRLVRTLRRFRRDRRGQALVEFALVVPILLLLVLGIIDFGRAWNLHQTITDAAREGARQAVVFDPDVDQDSVLRVIGRVINASGFDATEATVGFPDGFKSGRGTLATVTIEMPYRFGFLAPIVRLLSTDNTATMQLRTYARMRNE